MFKAAKKLAAYRRLEDCDIQAISICGDKYYTYTRSRFEKLAEIQEEPEELYRAEGVNPNSLDAASDDARYAMMGLFAMSGRTN